MKKLLCLALPLLMLLCACGKSEAPALLEPAKVQSDIETAYRGEIFNIVMYEASIEPEVVGQSFAESGSIDKLNVTVGDVVQAGDVLATLDITGAQDQRDQLSDQIEYLTTEHDFETKRLEYQIELLQRQGSGEENRLQQELLRLKIQEADELLQISLAELSEKLEGVDETLAGNTLSASCGGTVVKMAASPGGRVRADSDVVYIADDDTQVITCEYIPSADVEKCDRVYASIGGAEYDVEYIPYDRDEYLQLAITGAEMSATFKIINPTDEIKNGMFTCVYLVSDYVKDALKAPSNAVHTDSGGSFVYLAKDGEQVKQYVETGVATDAEVQILSGLEEGDAFYVAS